MKRVAAVLVAGVALVAACSGKSSSSTGSTTTSSTIASTTSSTGGATPSTSATTTTAAPATSATTATGARNLTVTDALRKELVAAAAADKGLTPADFTGMTPGGTYYAHDNQTNVDWAAGSVVPSRSSERAMVSSQDDGAYQLFSRSPGGAWRVYEDGMGGVAGTPCPVQIPAAVLAVWGWAPGSCQPPSR